MPKRRPRTQSLTFRLTVILIFVIALILFRMTGEIGPDRVPRDRFRVVRVIDGDTVELVGGDRLRLLAIDSPERGEPLYAAAKDYLAALVLDSTLDITYSERRRDRYGRILAYIWLDTVMVNERMLSAGLANLYIFEDNLGDRDQSPPSRRPEPGPRCRRGNLELSRRRRTLLSLRRKFPPLPSPRLPRCGPARPRQGGPLPHPRGGAPPRPRPLPRLPPLNIGKIGIFRARSPGSVRRLTSPGGFTLARLNPPCCIIGTVPTNPLRAITLPRNGLKCANFDIIPIWPPADKLREFAPYQT